MSDVISLTDLENELARTQRKLENWATGIAATAEDIRESHERAMHDRSSAFKPSAPQGLFLQRTSVTSNTLPG